MRLIDRIRTLFSNKDNTQLLKNVIGNYTVKGGALIVALLITPAYMSYFYSKTMLGVWFTAIQIFSHIALFDIGIGAGIRNQLVEPFEKKDDKNIKIILSSGYFSILVLVILLLAIINAVIGFFDWYRLLGIDRSDIDEQSLVLIVRILISGVVFRMASVLINHILYAMQQAIIPSLLNLSVNLFLLLYMKVTAPTGNSSDIVRLAYVQALANNAPYWITAAIVFGTVLKKSIPSIRYIRKAIVKKTLFHGTGLFYIQIVLTLVLGVKELMISWFVGADQVVNYNVYLKIIGMVSSLFSLALTPVWSAVTKAYVENNFKRIKGLYKTGLKVIAAFGSIQFVLVPFLPWITKIWLGKNAIEISAYYAIIYCLYNLTHMLTMLNYNFACGLGRTKHLSIYLTIALIGNLLLSWWWCGIYSSWVTVLIATGVSTLLVAILAPRSILAGFTQQNDKTIMA